MTAENRKKRSDVHYATVLTDKSVEVVRLNVTLASNFNPECQRASPVWDGIVDRPMESANCMWVSLLTMYCTQLGTSR